MKEEGIQVKRTLNASAMCANLIQIPYLLQSTTVNQPVSPG